MKNKVVKWYMQQAEYDDVIVSSRVRFARNLAEFDFRDKLDDVSATKMIEKVRSLTPELSGREGMEYYSCNVLKLTDVQKNTLVESHSVSQKLADKKQPTGLILSEDESVSIMINEDDHIRIQAVATGRNLREAYKTADRIDDFLDTRLHYAFSDKYGYLTSSLTDVGTGMRASYMMFLPGLAASGKLTRLTNDVAKFGIIIRGLYGEGAKSAGFLFLVSNRKTLGMTERDIFDNLDQIVGQIVSLEHKCREELLKADHDGIEDKVFRSYGVLKYTKSISTADAMTLLAQVKIGSDLGLIGLNGNGADIHRLMLEVQPAGVQSMGRRSMDKKERDRFRAEYLNSHLPGVNKE